MKRSRRTPRQFTMAHGLMVLAGVITFLTVNSVLRDRQETVEVVVAGHELLAGVDLSADAFHVVSIPADSDLVGQLATSRDIAADVRLGRDLASGEPLLVTDIRTGDVESGVRTLTVPVWRSTIEGLGLQTGDRVDLIGADTEGRLSYVVVGSVISRLPSSSSTGGAFGGESSRDSWITVEISDRDALDLALAMRSGSIEVVRSTGAPRIGVSQPQEQS